MKITFLQKLLALAIYMLPWSDSIIFGRYLFQEFPLLQWMTIPALPIIIIQKILPFGGLIIFLMLFLLVIRNPNISYFLRFNSLQAILINIIIIMISYVFQIIIQPLGNGLLIRTFSSTILVSMMTLLIFCIYECFQGKEPDLPIISEAVKIQL